MTPRAVALHLGISQSLLYAWEREMGWPQPQRLATGARVYSEADLRGLERVVAWRRQGWALRELVRDGILTGPPRPRCHTALGILARMRFSEETLEAIRLAFVEGAWWRLPGLRATIEARVHPRHRSMAWRLLRVGDRARARTPWTPI